MAGNSLGGCSIVLSVPFWWKRCWIASRRKATSTTNKQMLLVSFDMGNIGTMSSGLEWVFLRKVEGLRAECYLFFYLLLLINAIFAQARSSSYPHFCTVLLDAQKLMLVPWHPRPHWHLAVQSATSRSCFFVARCQAPSVHNHNAPSSLPNVVLWP